MGFIPKDIFYFKRPEAKVGGEIQLTFKKGKEEKVTLFRKTMA